MTEQPKIIPKSITDTVEEIKRFQEANPNCTIYFHSKRSYGRKLIMDLLQTTDAEMVEQKKLSETT